MQLPVEEDQVDVWFTPSLPGLRAALCCRVATVVDGAIWLMVIAGGVSILWQ